MTAPRSIVPLLSTRFHLKEVALFLLGALLAVPFWPRRVRLDFGELCEQIVIAIIVVLIVQCCPRRAVPTGDHTWWGRPDSQAGAESYKWLAPTPMWKRKRGPSRKAKRRGDNQVSCATATNKDKSPS